MFRWRWILDILVIVLPIFFVYSYIHHCYSVASRREVFLRYSKYRQYGDNLIYKLKSRDFSNIQQSLLSAGKGQISLEEIIDFTNKLKLEKSKEIKWNVFKEIKNKVYIRGQLILEGKLIYPLEIIFILKGKKALPKKLRVGSQLLQLHKAPFPLIY